jgi:predicted RNA binding protein YcfA (HicA-like mRNA interferase family)
VIRTGDIRLHFASLCLTTAVRIVPVKVSEAIKLLQDDGWVWISGRGGHRQFKHPAKPGRVTVAGKP